MDFRVERHFSRILIGDRVFLFSNEESHSFRPFLARVSGNYEENMTRPPLKPFFRNNQRLAHGVQRRLRFLSARGGLTFFLSFTFFHLFS